MRDRSLIINVALTGIVPTKDQTPHVPVTPEEIARDAKTVYDLGAAMVHVHARDREGRPSLEKEIYREIILRIRERCPDIIITVSTSGRCAGSFDERIDMLSLKGDAKPDMASLTLGSLNFMHDASVTTPNQLMRMVQAMKDAHIIPELEIFDTGMSNYAAYLFRNGILEGKHYTNLILGSLGAMMATPRNLAHIVDDLPEQCLWAATGVGAFAFDMQALSIAMGGHVRVGVEDSIYMDGSRELATNAKLVSRVKAVAESMQRPLMTARALREMLSLNAIP
jgi:3-keto-5-aminohexanoate cleavage enzyme